MSLVKWISFPHKADERGGLTVVESLKEIGFLTKIESELSKNI